METRNKILIVCTSADSYHERRHTPEELRKNPELFEEHNRTGADVKEIAYVYHYLSKRASYQLVLASSQNEYPIPFDPRSMQTSKEDSIVQEFLQDDEAMMCFKNPCNIKDVVDRLDDFSAVIFPGGPGCMFDLAHISMAETLTKVVTRIYDENDGIVATIGYGLSALLNVENVKSKEVKKEQKENKNVQVSKNAWLKNRAVTCNTIEEEKDMQLDQKMPFNLEKKLKELGVKFHKTDKFRPYVVVDERLITGQNHNSTKEWIETILKEIQKSR